MKVIRGILVILTVFLSSVSHVFAQGGNTVTGPNVVIQTDGTLGVGAVNIATQNAGPIRFFTNNTLRGYIDGTTGVLTGFTVGSISLADPIISGNLTFSTAAAKIIPGATSLTFRNNADSGSNLAILDAGAISGRGTSLNFGAATSSTVLLGTNSVDAADSDTLTISGANAYASDGSRGGGCSLDGNEVGGSGGSVLCQAGNVSTAMIDLRIEHASSFIRFRDRTSGDLLTISDAGALLAIGDLTNATAAKGVVLGEASRAATVTTATTLAVPLYVSAAASGTDLGAFIGSGASASGPVVDFFKTRAASGAATTIVASGDALGTVNFYGANGTTYDPAAQISANVDTTPGAATDMPGRLNFGVSLDGTATIVNAYSITNKGINLMGGATSVDTDISSALNPPILVVAGLDLSHPDAVFLGAGADSTGAIVHFLKTRGTGTDANTIVSSGDEIGAIVAQGADGAAYRGAAKIQFKVDGTPGSSDMPGSIIFSTAPDGSATVAQVLKLGNDKAATFSGAIVDVAPFTAGTGVTLGLAANPADVGNTAVYDFSPSATVPQLSLAQGTADTAGVIANFYKSRATDGTADTIIVSGDTIADLKFFGSNGTTFDPAAIIRVTSGGTPGASTDMPGKIDFLTSPDGSITPASALSLSAAKLATFGGGIVDVATFTAGTGVTLGLAANPADIGNTAIYDFSPSATVPQLSIAQGTADTAGAIFNIYKSRATDGTADTIVVSGDTIGTIKFLGSNGATFDPVASIVAKSNGTPGASTDMPGSLSFFTVPDSSATLTQALILDSSQNATFAGNTTTIGTIKSTRSTDIGWSVVAGANTACNTTCTNACVVGFDTALGGSDLVDCADATADRCLCAGAS